LTVPAFFLNQEQLILSNVLGSELIGRAMKMVGECGDVLEVQSNRSWVIITPPERDDPQFTLLSDLRILCRKAASFNKAIMLQPGSGFLQGDRQN
jgi:hypothetical protein